MLCVSRSIAAKDRPVSGFSFTSAAGIAALVNPEGACGRMDLFRGQFHRHNVTYSFDVNLGI